MKSSDVHDMKKRHAEHIRRIEELHKAVVKDVVESYIAQIIELNARITELESTAQLVSEHKPTKFFMYSEDSGFETHTTKANAIAAAQNAIDDYRGDSWDGWPEETDSVCWGVIVQKATETDHQKPDESNGWMGSVDYTLLPAQESE